MLKRFARYLKGNGRIQQKFSWQDAPQKLSTWSDTDHASCVLTRRSASGCVVAHGNNVIYHYSVTQATSSLSSGEAEHNGLAKAAAEGFKP
eukprot:5400177-Amphidinium_carterae.2